jgi:hypothetical protein
MTNTATETLSVVVEREIPFPPEKIQGGLFRELSERGLAQFSEPSQQSCRTAFPIARRVTGRGEGVRR